MTVPTDEFPRGTSGLPAASATPTVELSGGERFALRIAPVSKRIGDATVRMLAYNGSIPGPTLRVAQGCKVLVDVENAATSTACSMNLVGASSSQRPRARRAVRRRAGREGRKHQLAVDPDHAAGRLMYEGTAYFFCTLACAGAFARRPDTFTRRA